MTFRPKKPVPAEFQETLVCLTTHWRRNGQILGEVNIGWRSRGLVMVGRVPHPGALESVHHTEYARAWLERLRECCSLPPTCRIQTHDEPPSHLGNLEGLAAYYVDPFQSSPLRSATDGLGIPLYLLPLEGDDRERFFLWSQQYDAVATLEALAGSLELESYREMSDPFSLLNRQGRSWARLVESTTHTPTYYWLVHLYGDGNPTRPCPTCGQEWHVEPSGDGLYRFPFRCDVCRLVSTVSQESGRDPRGDWGCWSPFNIF